MKAPLTLLLALSILQAGTVFAAATKVAAKPAKADAGTATKPAKADADPEAKTAKVKPDAASDDEAASPKKENAEPNVIRTLPKARYIEIIRERAGLLPAVSVNYRWQVHQRGSIEVRLVTGEDAERVLVSPLLFVSELFKGAVATKIYHCLDGADDLGVTDSFTKEKMEYKIVAQKNSIGHPAVVVIPTEIAPVVKGGAKAAAKAGAKAGAKVDDKTGDKTGAAAEAAKRPRAVFPILDGWAVNDKELTLDLPRESFGQPGVLHVWFIRGDRVLWEDVIDWPGK